MHGQEPCFFMEENQGSIEPKAPSTVTSRQGMYAKVAKHSDKILKTLIELLDSRNESMRLGAANKLIDKILPDLKATELTGETNGPIMIRLISEVISDDGNRSTNPELPSPTVNL